MRYLIKYTKEDSIKYVAHLELMRTIQRIIRRSELPAEYSKGFNPHIILSIAQPLSVGVCSKGEYLDVEFSEQLDENYIKYKLNESAPLGIRFLEVVKTREKIGEKKAPPSMAAVEAATYTISLKCNNSLEAEKTLKELLNENEWKITKRTKKGEKEVNIRPLIYKIRTSIKENKLNIDTLVSCGSKENLSAQILADYIKSKIDYVDNEAFVYIERKELFSYQKEKIISLSEYFK